MVNRLIVKRPQRKKVSNPMCTRADGRVREKSTAQPLHGGRVPFSTSHVLDHVPFTRRPCVPWHVPGLQSPCVASVRQALARIAPGWRGVPHPTPYTLHPTPYTLHPTPYTLYPTPDTLHPTPYTLSPTPHTQDPTSYTLNPKPQTLNCTP